MNIAGGSVFSGLISSHKDLTDIGTNDHPTIDNFIASKGQANGLAPLDGLLKIPLIHLPTSSNVFKGLWNANTNTPQLLTGGVGGILGDYYIVNIAGTTLIDGINTWDVGDWIINTGKWERIDNPDPELVDLLIEYKTLKDQPIKNNTTPTDPKHLTPKDYVDNIIIDHNNLLNKGTNTHAQIDAHILDDSKHRLINDLGNSPTELLSSQKILNIENNLQGQITNNDNDILALQNKTQKLNSSGDASTKISYASAQTFSNPLDIVSKDYVDGQLTNTVDHNNLLNKGTNTHAQIDAHISDDSKHRLINDLGNSATELFSSQKILNIETALQGQITNNDNDILTLQNKTQKIDTNGNIINTITPNANGVYNLGADILNFNTIWGVNGKFTNINANSYKNVLHNVGFDIANTTDGQITYNSATLYADGNANRALIMDGIGNLNKSSVVINTQNIECKDILCQKIVGNTGGPNDLVLENQSGNGIIIKDGTTGNICLNGSAYTGNVGKYLKIDDNKGLIVADTPAGGGGSGDVVGPSASSDNAIARYDSTTGKLIQNSTVILTDTGAINNVLSIEPTSSENVSFGINANTAGATNISLGSNAGNGNIGQFNIMVGRNSKNGSGGENIAIGDTAGSVNMTGAYNICIGSGSGSDNLTSNNECIYIGRGINNIGVTGNNMICIGNGSTKRPNEVVLGSLTTTHWRPNGNNHCDLGYYDGTVNNSQFKNLYLSGDIYKNGAVGVILKTPNITNLIAGVNAGTVLSTATENVLLGSDAGRNVNTASYNILLGRSSGQNIQGNIGNQGEGNIAIGYECMFGVTAQTTALYNTAVGAFSLYSITTGEYNTSIGTSSGFSLTSGNRNTFVGFQSADADPIMQDCVALGFNATPGSGNNRTAIGQKANCDADNQVCMGDVNTTQLINSANGVCDLGSTTHQFKNLYISGDIYVNGVKMLLTPAP